MDKKELEPLVSQQNHDFLVRGKSLSLVRGGGGGGSVGDSNLLTCSDIPLYHPPNFADKCASLWEIEQRLEKLDLVYYLKI